MILQSERWPSDFFFSFACQDVKIGAGVEDALRVADHNSLFWWSKPLFLLRWCSGLLVLPLIWEYPVQLDKTFVCCIAIKSGLVDFRQLKKHNKVIPSKIRLQLQTTLDSLVHAEQLGCYQSHSNSSRQTIPKSSLRAAVVLPAYVLLSDVWVRARLWSSTTCLSPASAIIHAMNIIKLTLVVSQLSALLIFILWTR